jgi:hypothetical protein
MTHLPSFDDLPAVKDMPQGCAWGIFDKDGKKDLRGTLNILTPEIVAEACNEARDGISISLKLVSPSAFRNNKTRLLMPHCSWPLNANKVPMGRSPPTHKKVKLSESGLSEGCGWDDEITFNTQVGTCPPIR